MRRLPPAPTNEESIDGRRAVADALAVIMGHRVSPYSVDRLATRRRHALPLRGYLGKRWAFRSELVAWWNEEQRRLRDGEEAA